MLSLILLYQASAWEIKNNSLGNPLHWPQPQIEFYHNVSDSNLSAAQVQQAMSNAAQTWNFSYTEFIHKGEYALQSIDYEDDYFMVFFNKDWNEDPNILALTYTWSRDNGEIVHFDIELNAEHFSWSTDGQEDKHDLQNTLTHELGHVLGLDHSSVTDATMAPTSNSGETQKRVLHEDDKMGHQEIYAHPLEQGSTGTSTTEPPPNSGTSNHQNPTYTGNGNYGVRKPVSACSTSKGIPELFWLLLLSCLHRRQSIRKT